MAAIYKNLIKELNAKLQADLILYQSQPESFYMWYQRKCRCYND